MSERWVKTIEPFFRDKYTKTVDVYLNMANATAVYRDDEIIIFFP